MPDQVKLEPPPGQDMLNECDNPPVLLFYVPGAIEDEVERLSGQLRTLAACVGAEMWRREAERLRQVDRAADPMPLPSPEAEHALAQCCAWRRWGGLT